MNSHTRSPSHHNTWPTVTLRHLYNLSCQEGSLLLALNPVLHNEKWVGCSIHFCIHYFLLNFRHSVTVHEDKLTLYISVCLTIDFWGFYSNYNTGINYCVYYWFNNNNLEYNGSELSYTSSLIIALIVLSPFPDPVLWHQKWISK